MTPEGVFFCCGRAERDFVNSATLDLLTKWFSKKSVFKKVQEKVISAIKTAKTG